MKGTKDLHRNQTITRRSFMIMSGQAGLLSILTGKMLYMQVVDAKKYRILSDKNRINLVMLAPARGEILDSHKKVMCTNHSAFRLILNKTENPKYEEVVQKVASLLALSKIDCELLEKVALKIPKKQPSPLFENLSWNQVAIIEENIDSLPGIYIDTGQYRKYNFPYIMSHPIGYISTLNKQDKIELDLKNVGDFQIGKNGVEKYYEAQLQGSFGMQEIEVNAHGMLVREISKISSTPGTDIQTNIDSDIQTIAMDILSPKGASAVVLDLEDGKVVTMASTPGFDPNKFIGGVSQDYWQKLLNDPYKPLINKAVQSNYPPGSIFKMIVILAALESGMDPNIKVSCTGHSVLGDSYFRCWYRPGHGDLNMAQAIEQSCNSYMYYIAKIVGIKKISEVARKFGLGTNTGVDLPSESSGLIPDELWKKTRFKEAWHIGDTLNTSIGQGFALTTPIQLARLCGAIATGGKLFVPRIVGTTGFSIVDIDPEHLNFVKNGMNNVINSTSGTAYSQRIIHNDWKMAGKTGTSQVRAKTGDINLNSSVPWASRNHALFIGYAPVEKPRFAVSVAVDHGGGGGSVAAPIAKELLLALRKKYNSAT